MGTRPWVVGIFGIILGIVLGYSYANDKTNRAMQELSTIKSEFSDSQTQHSKKVADFDKKVADLETQLSAAVKKAEGAAAELTSLKGESDEENENHRRPSGEDQRAAGRAGGLGKST